MANAKLKTPVIALGLDPGKVNFGWAVVAARSLEDYVMLDNGMLYSVMSQVPEITATFVNSVVNEVLSIISVSDVTHMAIERFHPRGRFVPMDQVEYNNVMIGGIISSVSSLSEVKQESLTAAQWKRQMYFEEGITYKDWFPDAQEIHSGDAGCMALCSLWRNQIVEWPGFDFPNI